MKPYRKLNTLSGRKFIPKKAINLAAVFLLLITNRSIGSGWQGCDDFSSGITSSNWPVDKVDQDQMIVTNANGHVSFLVPVSTIVEQNGYRLARDTDRSRGLDG
jgi:hypothetical protein